MSKIVLTVGPDPALVAASASSRAAFPDVGAETIRMGVAASREKLSTADAVLRWLSQRAPLADAWS